MCGICGNWNYADSKPSEREMVRRMAGAMVHRGPDDEGTFFDDAAGLGFGFRRLSIIDLSPTGHQPMGNEDGSVQVMLNGEIYNFVELRTALEARGHRFRSASDTECVVHQYEERGPDCIRDLNGMFGLAIWDGPRRRLVLARDRVGKKPLYYYDDGKRFLFGSELKAILQDDTVPRDLDFDALAEYLRVGYVGSPRTIFKGVRKLEPGHVLVFDGKRCQLRRYWDWLPDFAPKTSLTEADHIERIRETLRECVKNRLISDVPLGAFLSGGIDSSAVVAMMAASCDRPVKTFSIGFENEAFNELPYARQVAERFGTEHHEFVVKPESLSDILPKLARQFDEPFADSSALPAYYVSKMARQHVTVCLSGDGGDETMAGYPHYDSGLSDRLIDAVPQAVRGPLLGGFSRLIPPFVRGHRLLSRFSQTPEQRYACRMQIAYRSQVEAVLNPAVVRSLEHPPILLERVLAGPLPAGFLSKMQYADERAYLPEDILTKVDRTSMVNSLEARCPMLDPRFMKVAAAIPDELRMKKGCSKMIFKKALRGIVPDSVIDRPKMGFSIPGKTWLGADASDFVSDILGDESVNQRGFFRADVVRAIRNGGTSRRPETWPLTWALLVFELWCRTWLDARSV
jgi:asparagine synthase (glutamine-hydrolysing)